VLLVAGVCGVAWGAPSDDAEAIQRIADAYLKNRSATEPLKCAFKYAKGRAANVEEAIAKGPTMYRLTAECSLAISGANICYKRIVDWRAVEALRESMANPTKSKDGKHFFAQIPLDEEHLLTDGVRALHYDPDFVANMVGPDKEKLDLAMNAWMPLETPWALGGMGRTLKANPGCWLVEGKMYKEQRLLGPRKIDGLHLIAVECLRESSSTIYYFDPERGHLPVRREWKIGEDSKGWVVMKAVEKLDRGRWFPKHVVSVRSYPSRDIHEVEEVILTSIDADYVFKPEDFVLEMLARTLVNHTEDLRSEFRLQKDTRLGLADLEALHKRCLERLEEVKKEQGEGK